jgi:putative selenate reductase
MSDRMKVLPFERLLEWAIEEHERHGSIFGIPDAKFYRPGHKGPVPPYELFGRALETPFGPAAGPHTQLAQNIVSAYLTGCRVMELKTVQEKDDLDIEKPCIDASDEGYNTEWSQELSLDESADEYVKAWVLIHVLRKRLRLSAPRIAADGPGFVFNMSVGYDLKGIQSAKMEHFLARMLAPGSEIGACLETARKTRAAAPASIVSGLDVSGDMIHGVTISTMHGCPPSQIEAMARYLIGEKGLNTYVKLNPTLLGKTEVRETLEELGWGCIRIEDEIFDKDLQYRDALRLVGNLAEYAEGRGKRFGVKLSNTLANKNEAGPLPGPERYMSGRALFPITIRLAHRIASDFDGKIDISFCGGASALNIGEILSAGIFPVTLTTDALKPGGYLRFHQIALELEAGGILPPARGVGGRVDVKRLGELAAGARRDSRYRKDPGRPRSIKVSTDLELFDCITTPCAAACPIHQDVPEYIGAIERGDWTGALLVILRKNPLPNITGYICDHACVGSCVRWDYENPIHIRDLKRVAAGRGDRARVLRLLKEERKSKKTGKKVAVIGSGAAGLAAGFFLAREGFGVHIFERDSRPGGTVRQAIPGFRLPDEVIEEDVDLIKGLGVEIRTGWREELSVEGMKKAGFDYLVVATGSSSARGLGLDPGGVEEGYYTGLEFLRRVKAGESLPVGKKVVVIGGGNSAVDAARTALRFRPERVRVVYRRDLASMPADREEVDACLEEGVEFEALLGPLRLLAEGGRLKGVECVRMRLGEPDGSGRPRPMPVDGSETVLEADTLIAAAGEEVETAGLLKNGIALGKGNTVAVEEETGETSVPGVYAAGDCVGRGPATVVEAVAGALKVAKAILRREGRDVPGYLVERPYTGTAERGADGAPASNLQPGGVPVSGAFARESLQRHGRVFPFHPVRTLPLAERVNFRTVIETLRPEDALTESGRCLRCDLLCGRCVETCPNRANVAVGFEPAALTVPVFSGPPDRSCHTREYRIAQATQILHLDDFCNECGNCETFCPHLGAPYRDKPTLFSDPGMFEDSDNSGFVMVKGGESARFRCRAGGVEYDMEVRRGRGELAFRSGEFDLAFDLGAAPRLKTHRVETAGTLDTGPMVGLFLLADAAFARYPYLFKNGR